VCSQIEIHPYFDQHRLVDFCKERNMAVIGYSSFGSPNRPWLVHASLVTHQPSVVNWQL